MRNKIRKYLIIKMFHLFRVFHFKMEHRNCQWLFE
jgi:hypothetical protein